MNLRLLSPKYMLATLLVLLALTGSVAAQGLLQNDHGQPLGTPGKPLEVGIGIHIDQITFVDQKSENYGAVATLRFRWKDPALAYELSEYPRDVRVFKTDAFLEYATENTAIVPAFVIENQQSNRWIHQSVIAVRSNGEASYFEKSSLTLQAPYFDFRKYPFDTQRFYYEIVSVFPSQTVRYSVLEDESGLGQLLGEEEWILENAQMQKSTVTGLSGMESDKVALEFTGRRHVLYYAIRIFLPMLVLVSVSWSLFFLDEYRKRIEIAGANLLVFVGFNWVISDDLPKLGYVTFLDFILQWMFVVTGAIIVFNVVLRRLKLSGRETFAAKLDNYAVKWIYPLAYVAIVGFAVLNFLVKP
ncbi:MAG: hypothetical protein AB3N15_16105 [Paracoccaceae bacterium]